MTVADDAFMQEISAAAEPIEADWAESAEQRGVDGRAALMTKSIRNMLTLIMDWISALVLAVLAWQLWHKTQSIAADGQVTNTLEIPLPPPSVTL